MPVSHIGLTVSHIPTATSFYLSALQPLGYRFIGNQGDSIGFGIDSADFFITQSPHGARVFPNHIAFLADSHLTVSDCFDAAVTAGGKPSGEPDYRNGDCSCYNAAVEDPDGNTIEFIYRQPHSHLAPESASPPSYYTRSSRSNYDTRDDDRSTTSRTSHPSQTRSRMQTVVDLARSVKSTHSEILPSGGLTRSFTDPVKRSTSEISSKAFLGTVLGAAAGAAIAFAMVRSEDTHARDEVAYSSTSRSRPSAPRAETLPPSVAPSRLPPPPPATQPSRKSHRNYSPTESSAIPSRPGRQLAIEAAPAPSRAAPSAVQDSLSRASSRRTSRHKSTYDDSPAYELPISSSSRSSTRSSRTAIPPDHPSISRATTLPVDAPTSISNSRSRRRESRSPNPRSRSRHDSMLSTTSQRTPKPAPAPAPPQSSNASRRGSLAGSKTSTLKPSPPSRGRDYSAAVVVPVPPSSMSTRKHNHARRHSSSSGSRAPSTAYFSAVAAPKTEVGGGGLLEELDPVVTPEDSISCVGGRRRRKEREESGRRGERDWERDAGRDRGREEEDVMLRTREGGGRGRRASWVAGMMAEREVRGRRGVGSYA